MPTRYQLKPKVPKPCYPPPRRPPPLFSFCVPIAPPCPAPYPPRCESECRVITQPMAYVEESTNVPSRPATFPCMPSVPYPPRCESECRVITQPMAYVEQSAGGMAASCPQSDC